jgi:type I restriction enzyme, S subunit
MSLAKYSQYKVCSESWLETIPAHWSTPPLYLRYSVELGKMLDAAKITGAFPTRYLRNVDVQWGRINVDELPTMDIQPHEVDRYSVRNGDLLVCEGGEVGRAAIASGLAGKIGFQKALHRLRGLATQEHPNFMFYTLRWAAEHGVFNGEGQSTIAHLTGEQLRKYRFPKPPMAEQKVIAAFLDSEAGKIDALIAEQQKLISLLAEKSHATISHIVMRGLNAGAPMKDSGVEWMGDVPAHWEVVRTKRILTRIEQGWSPQCENYPIDDRDEWGVLKVGCVNGGVFSPSENKKLPKEVEALSNYSLKRDDLLISRANTRELVGGAAVVPSDFPRLLLCDKLYRLRLKSAECIPLFLAAYLGTRQARSQIELHATGASSSMLNIGQSVILDLRLPLPPLQEQREVVKFIAHEINRLDILKSEAERAIALLKERRAALITAAVTGQIDVRGATRARDSSNAIESAPG